MSDLRYPIGPLSYPQATTASERAQWIGEIAACPAALRAAVAGLTEEQLSTPYRPDGWTVRQVVHHVADSHINAWVRCKWTLTESHPTIKAYHEAEWAKLPDYSGTPIEVSLSLLEMLHLRWVVLLESLNDEQWQRAFHHPESRKDVRMEQLPALYAWHGKHHTAHITALRARMGW